MINNKYKTLFTIIAQTVEMTAETAMEYNKKENNLSSYKTAKDMRAKYGGLYDRLRLQKDYELTKQDYIDLSIGTVIVTNYIEGKVKEQQEALRGYKEDLIPKLQEVIKVSEEEVSSVADKLFTLEDKPNS